MTAIVCGVDVASSELEARIGMDGPGLRVANTQAGIAELESFCRQHGVGLVAMEATGGYEKLVFATLWTSGLACAVLNPRAVRSFARAMGILEKTDRIDAGLIARYAEVKGVQAQPPASDLQQQLRELVDRLMQVTKVMIGQKHQRRHVNGPMVLQQIDDVLALLRRQSQELSSQIAALLARDPLWQALEQEMRSIKGIAERTIGRILALLPEIGTIPNKAVAKLVGLAPIARDSGKASKPRHIRGGRQGVRDVLVLVAAVACKYEPDFIAFKQKLKNAGKPPMVIRVAAARKLLVRLNAKARDVRKNFALPA